MELDGIPLEGTPPLSTSKQARSTGTTHELGNRSSGGSSKQSKQADVAVENAVITMGASTNTGYFGWL
jgi:hypothetical protein